MAAADPDHYLVLDARRPVEEIAAAVRERVAPLLGQARDDAGCTRDAPSGTAWSASAAVDRGPARAPPAATG